MREKPDGPERNRKHIVRTEKKVRQRKKTKGEREQRENIKRKKKGEHS